MTYGRRMALGATTRVLVIRHGQSEWNLAGRWQGQADPPLTDLGRTQARQAARALGTVDAIWASDLQRAAETAAIISRELGVGPVVLDDGLRERDVGEWEGLTRADIDEQFPGYLPSKDQPRTTGTTVRRPPSWETDEALLTRLSGTFARICREVGPGEVLVIGHAGTLYGLERSIGGEGDRLANLDGRWFELMGSRLDGASDPSFEDFARLGDRVRLLPSETTTTPKQL